MNIILLSPEDCINTEQARLTGAAFEHCTKTLNVSLGDSIHIGLINQSLGKGIIKQIADSHIIIDTTFGLAAPKKLALNIILAMPRPKVLKRVLRNAAELGVNEIILLNAYKVEKSYWQSPVIEQAPRYFQEGLEQAKDCIPPKFSIQQRFKPFVEDTLPTLIKNSEAYVAHPYNNANALKSVPESTQPRWVVIGPEGGFIPYEVEKLIEAGCQPISMGDRIYRVENAVSLLIQGLS